MFATSCIHVTACMLATGFRPNLYYGYWYHLGLNIYTYIRLCAISY